MSGEGGSDGGQILQEGLQPLVCLGVGGTVGLHGRLQRGHLVLVRHGAHLLQGGQPGHAQLQPEEKEGGRWVGGGGE